MNERSGPSKLPLGWLTLAAAITARRLWRLRLCAASACGLAWMRTAGRCPPARLTSPTPGNCDSFCAMRVSTRSYTSGSGIVGDVMASVSTGVSAGLTLL